MPIPFLLPALAAAAAGAGIWGTKTYLDENREPGSSAFKWVNPKPGSERRATGPGGALEELGRRTVGSSSYSNPRPTPSTSYLDDVLSGRYRPSYSGSAQTDPLTSLTTQVGQQGGTYQDYLSQLGLSPEMLAAQLQSTIGGNNPIANLLGTPTDQTQAWLEQVNKAYGPALGYAKSVIPAIQNEGKRAKKETRRLYDIAEEGLLENAEQTRNEGMAAASQQADNIAKIVNAYSDEAEMSEADYLAELNQLGIPTEGRGEITDRAAEQSQLMGQEGALRNNRMAEGSAATADYLQEVAGIQDAAAAAYVTDLSNQVADLVFQQQGRISDLQSQRGAAQLDAMMKARSDYLAQIGMYADAQQQGIGNFLDMANLNRSLYGDYVGYNMQGDQLALDQDAMRLREQELLASLQGGGNEPVEGYLGAAQRASGGDPNTFSAIVSVAGQAGQQAMLGDITGAIATLESAGVPTAAATQFVFDMVGEYG